MKDLKEAAGVQESREHIRFHRGLYMTGRKEIFVDSKSKFAQRIHRSMGIFSEKTAVVFRKGDI